MYFDFRLYLKEEATEEKLKHLAHPGDHVIGAGATGLSHAINTLRETHKALQGKQSKAKISTKYDGAPSIVFGRHPESGKFFVASKSAFNKSPKINYDDKDIDANHGDSPGLAEKLKHALKHLPKVTPEHGVYQGDVMHSQEDVKEEDGKVSTTPNVMTYSAPKDSEAGKKMKRAKIGVAVHTAYHGSTLQDMKAEYNHKPANFNNHPDVHVIDTSTGKASISPEDSKKVQKHLDAADELGKDHDWSHMQGHDEHMKQYINDTVRKSTKPTTEGYKAFVMAKGEKKISGFKSEKGQAKAKAEHVAMLDSITANKKHFDKTLQIHQHVEKAKDILTHNLANNVEHPLEHTINGKPSKPEGFVVSVGNRPTKLVDREEFSKANFDQARYAKKPAAEQLEASDRNALFENYSLGMTSKELGMKIRGAFAFHPSTYKYLTDEQIEALDDHDKVLFAKFIKQRNVVDE